MTFYQTIAHHYDQIFPLQPMQADFIHRRLPDNATLLEVGCATGSLALKLASLGHRVTGVDLSSELLMLARQKATDAHGSVVFHQLDMTAIAGQFQPGHFTAITCMGNTLSHLPLAKVFTFLQTSQQLLTQNGLMIFQIVNHDRLQKQNLSFLPTIDNSFIRFERKYINFDGASPFIFHAKLTVKSERKSYEASETLYPHTESQLRQGLKSAGFGSIKFFGNYRGAPAGGDHLPLIAVATR